MSVRPSVRPSSPSVRCSSKLSVRRLKLPHEILFQKPLPLLSSFDGCSPYLLTFILLSSLKSRLNALYLFECSLQDSSVANPGRQTDV
ncbi:hypothetical protein LINPERPRIM_LOCUS3013 [Linum perenne]